MQRCGSATVPHADTFAGCSGTVESSLLKLHNSGRLTAEATTQALRFLGNARAKISTERRKRVAGYLNKDLHLPEEESNHFTSAAHLPVREGL